MNVLSGFYSSSIMYLYPKCHDSSLRDKNQPLGSNLVEFTHATRVLQETLVFLQESSFWKKLTE